MYRQESDLSVGLGLWGGGRDRRVVGARPTAFVLKSLTSHAVVRGVMLAVELPGSPEQKKKVSNGAR